jgi:hypothetical protein
MFDDTVVASRRRAQRPGYFAKVLMFVAAGRPRVESAAEDWNVQRPCLCHLRGFGENVRVFLGQCLERELGHVGVLLVG